MADAPLFIDGWLVGAGSKTTRVFVGSGLIVGNGVDVGRGRSVVTVVLVEVFAFSTVFVGRAVLVAAWVAVL